MCNRLQVLSRPYVIFKTHFLPSDANAIWTFETTDVNCHTCVFSIQGFLEKMEMASRRCNGIYALRMTYGAGACIHYTHTWVLHDMSKHYTSISALSNGFLLMKIQPNNWFKSLWNNNPSNYIFLTVLCQYKFKYKQCTHILSTTINTVIVWNISLKQTSIPKNGQKNVLIQFVPNL